MSKKNNTLVEVASLSMRLARPVLGSKQPIFWLIDAMRRQFALWRFNCIGS